MTENELTQRIKAKLEEYSPYDPAVESFLVTESDDGNRFVKPLDGYIADTMEDACNEALMMIPLHLIRSRSFLGSQLVHGCHCGMDDLTGYVVLPGDFLRLVSFKMCGWRKDVVKPTSTTSPAYALQKNRYTMGTPYAPVCALARNIVYDAGAKPAGEGLTLEYYSVFPFTCHKVERASYVARFDKTDIQDDLSEYFALATACKVLDIMGQQQQSQMLSQELATLIQNNTM